uniref:C-C motif chemokine ligand 16 n=1 Tax=Ochotona pusilla TaxID=228609 RepID=A0A411ELE3_OCHPU|nr:C-C motif chemokine ligand 16 [Ochotona pusilla]
MKVSMATLCLLVLLLTTPVLCSQSEHKEVGVRMPIGINLSADCCLKFYKRMLPRRLLKGYRNAVRCHPPAISFITIKNREVCTNFKDNWVQEYLQDPDLPLLPPSTPAWS